MLGYKDSNCINVHVPLQSGSRLAGLFVYPLLNCLFTSPLSGCLFISSLSGCLFLLFQGVCLFLLFRGVCLSTFCLFLLSSCLFFYVSFVCPLLRVVLLLQGDCMSYWKLVVYSGNLFMHTLCVVYSAPSRPFIVLLCMGGGRT